MVHAALVIACTLSAILAWRCTVTAAQRQEAIEQAMIATARVGVLERLLRARGRTMRALADMLAGR